MIRNIDKNNIGNAGEYYIACRLSAKNFVATITLGRAEKYDILALSPNGKTFKISVKTRLKRKEKRFPLNKKDEVGGSEDFFYALVRLNEFEQEPDFWIIPSKKVNALLQHSSHLYFNVKKRKDGENYVDVGLRNIWLIKNKTNRDLYPSTWWEELDTFYKNFKQLK